MSNILTLYASIFIVIIIFLILYLIKKRRINIKYSVIWLSLFGLLLIFLLIPGFLNLITKALGFSLASNMIFSLLLAVLVIINIGLTVIVSSLYEKIRVLTQEISILKSKRNDDE